MRLSFLAAVRVFLAATTAFAQPKTIDWVELIPEDQRSGFDPAPPPPAHDYLSGEGGLAGQQIMDFRVNAKLDGQQVRLPGFIVPLELDAKGLVTEFFLVPYFGACIHVPPPPPNQMVYVVMSQGLTLDSAQNALGGGGRYDGLVEDLGGQRTPGIGFALGLDRTLLACDDEGSAP